MGLEKDQSAAEIRLDHHFRAGILRVRRGAFADPVHQEETGTYDVFRRCHHHVGGDPDLARHHRGVTPGYPRPGRTLVPELFPVASSESEFETLAWG